MRLDLGPPLEEVKARLCGQIDVDAEAVRLGFITPGNGQAMAYQQKHEEARAYLADSSIDEALIPHIVAEVGITGPTKHHVAQIVANLRDHWAVVSARIEHARLAAKVAIDAAETPTAAHAAAAIDWPAIINPAASA